MRSPSAMVTFCIASSSSFMCTSPSRSVRIEESFSVMTTDCPSARSPTSCATLSPARSALVYSACSSCASSSASRFFASSRSLSSERLCVTQSAKLEPAACSPEAESFCATDAPFISVCSRRLLRIFSSFASTSTSRSACLRSSAASFCRAWISSSFLDWPGL